MTALAWLTALACIVGGLFALANLCVWYAARKERR